MLFHSVNYNSVHVTFDGWRGGGGGGGGVQMDTLPFPKSHPLLLIQQLSTLIPHTFHLSHPSHFFNPSHLSYLTYHNLSDSVAAPELGYFCRRRFVSI